MKKIIVGIIFFFSSQLGFSQNSVEKNSLSLPHPFGKYLNKCFTDLEPINYLKSHPLTQKKELCNLAILLYLEVYHQDSLFNEAIYIRLKQIANKFYKEGTPVLIVGNGMNSIESALKLNNKGNPYGITFISMGNSCLNSTDVDNGIKKFNQETKKLVNYIEPVNEIKKNKKRNTTTAKKH
ncbi:MAG: hypothetical protein ACO1OF_23450 [Adhaeribacter sp.]